MASINSHGRQDHPRAMKSSKDRINAPTPNPRPGGGTNGSLRSWDTGRFVTEFHANSLAFTSGIHVDAALSQSRESQPRSKPPVVLLLGPERKAVSGVSTHLNLLFNSSLTKACDLHYFQVGSEGRLENRLVRWLRILTSPLLLAFTILRHGVNIVHLNTSLNRRAYWRDLAYLLVARACGSRVLYQIHGGKLPMAFCAGSPLRATGLRASLRLPDVIVVLARCELLAYRAFLPGQHVLVLPNAIDPALYARALPPVPAATTALRLVYLGRLAREKGLYDALGGLCLALKQGVVANLTIAGSGPDSEGLKRCVAKLKLDEHVRFIGPVFDQAKIDLLHDADVFIFPTYAEGLPYALLECMAAGVPAITTPVGAIPDVMVDGIHGLLIPPNDVAAVATAIVTLARKPGLVAQMGDASRQRVTKHYTITRLATELIGLYAELSLTRSRRSVSKP